jgi:hypothetical protein
MHMQNSSRKYLNEHELADRLGMTVKWLQKMRLLGGGIPFHRFGRAVRYSIEDIERYEAASRRSSTSDPGAWDMYTHGDRDNFEKGRSATREDRFSGDLA